MNLKSYFFYLFCTKASSIFADWPDVTIFPKLICSARNQSKAQQLFVRQSG